MSVFFRQALLMFLIVAVITSIGCSGGGSANPAMNAVATPEEAVLSLVSQWNTADAPYISVTPTGEKSVNFTQPSVSERTISFRDLSGSLWVFNIIEVIRTGENRASVKTSYAFRDSSLGAVYTYFHMILEQGVWYLDNIIVENLPAVSVYERGIQGYITDESSGAPVEGAMIQLFRSGESTSIASTSSYDNGYYSFSNLQPGSYTIVVARDDFILKTITDITVQ